mmetsp:Transcript_46381/g.143137  ORF Transcript_46381/g.143137 Transcript_46381/m.143137 type:complete len:1170 (-) Transcript_46381:64-3573(-)
MSCALPEISGGSAGGPLPTPPGTRGNTREAGHGDPTPAAVAKSARVVPSSRPRTDTASSNNSRRRAGVPPLIPDRAIVTSWPARSGVTADKNAGPNLSAHLARVSTATSAQPNATAHPQAKSAPSTARAGGSRDADELPLPAQLNSLRGGLERAHVDHVLPHLVNADRPAQTARVSTAAAAEGIRNKPPLVMQLEAYIRKELRLIGQRELPHRTMGRSTANAPATARSMGTTTKKAKASAAATKARDGFEEEPFPARQPGAAVVGPTPPSTAQSHVSKALVVATPAEAPSAAVSAPVTATTAYRAPRLHGLVLAPDASTQRVATATQTGVPPRPEQPRDALLPYSANTDGTLIYDPAGTSDPTGHERGAALRQGSAERLVVFNEAFRVLVQHFSEYEDLFHTIKAEFDAAIRDGERHRHHTRELERELATAHGYVTYIVESETEKIRMELRRVEAERDAQRKRADAFEAQLAAAIEARNKTQAEFDRLVDDIGDGHQRNKLLSDALRADAERQASTVANLNQLRKQNDHLQRYARALEDRARDDALVIENLSDTLKDLGYAHLAPGGSGAASPTAGGGPDGAPHAYSEVASPTSARAPEASPSADAGHQHQQPQPARAAGGATQRLQMAAQAVGAGAGAKMSLAKVTRTLLETNTAVPERSISPGAGGAVLNTSSAASFSRPPGRGGVSVDVVVDGLETELLRAREKARKYHRLAVSLQKTAQHQRKTIQSLSAHRGDRPKTPRPEWKQLRKSLPDFNPSPESTSDALLRELQEHIDSLRDEHRVKVEAEGLSRAIQQWLGDEDLCESDLGAFSKTFVGRGTGPEVPSFLRFHGRVRNRRLRKGDVERLLSQFWADREERRRADGDGVSRIQDFALDWLTRTTGAASSGIELAYNIVDVCEKNLHDPDCSLFVEILFGRLCEEAYFESMRSIEQLQRVIRAADKRNIGTIARTQMFRLIRKLYPGKSQEHMLKLRFALVAHSPEDGVVSYIDLFDEDTNGNQTRFVEYLRNQHVDEAREFAVDLAEEIRDSAASGDEVSLAEARTALKKLDPAIPEPSVVKTMCAGFALTAEALATTEERTKVPVTDFLARVRAQVFLMRHSPKPSTLTHIDRGDGAGADDPALGHSRSGWYDEDFSSPSDEDDDDDGGAPPDSPASPTTGTIPDPDDE